MRLPALFLALTVAGHASATGELNVLTDLFSPFPPGCVALNLPEAPASEDNVIWDEIVAAPSVETGTLDSEVRVQIWRTGCADEGRSVVMVRLQNRSQDRLVLVPQIFVEAGESELPFHEAQLITQPAVGNIGASGNVLSSAGQTFMVAADPVSIDEVTFFSVDEYNELFTLELFWGGFAPAVSEGELFPIFPYEPALDPPQFDIPLLHGRMSGSYTVPGKAATGLFLNVAETLVNTPDGPVDANFVFAVFFTYLDGEPVWVVGNTPGFTYQNDGVPVWVDENLPGVGPGAGRIELEMQIIEGGRFFTDPGSFTDADTNRESIGTLEIEVLDCNNLLLNYDFAASGLGVGNLTVVRLARIAGYDCNPWN